MFVQPFGPYSQKQVDKSYRYIEPETGRRYQLVSMTGPGGGAKGNPEYEVMGVTRHWRYSREEMQELINQGLVVQTKPGNVPRHKYYLDEGRGVAVQSLWDDIPNLQASSKESTGYPTQKPQALARRIIEASSNPGDLVLDCFAGCAYVPVVAELIGRRWIACDFSPRAWTVVRRQFHKQDDLRIVTEGDYTERDTGVQPDLGPERIIKVRGPHDLPLRSTNGQQKPLGIRDIKPIQFRQKPYEDSKTIWSAFVAEWGTECWYCGTEKAADRRELQLDHIEPNQRDGSNDDCWNRALACIACNSDKSDRLTPEQTMDRALEDGRVSTQSLRDEQMESFERRRRWAANRWESIRPRMLVV